MATEITNEQAALSLTANIVLKDTFKRMMRVDDEENPNKMVSGQIASFLTSQVANQIAGISGD